jgi:hypothetical protein
MSFSNIGGRCCGVTKSDGTGLPAIQFIFMDKTGANIGNVSAAGTTSTSYAVVSAFGAAPTNTVSAEISLENATATTSSCWFDDINLQAILTSSSTLNGQGSISTVSDYAFSYAATTTTITWTWSAFLVYCPNGVNYTVAASTGTATTYSLPTVGTVQTSVAGAPIEYSGLSSSHTYNFTPYVTLNGNGTGTVNILWTDAATPTLAQEMTTVNADTNVGCSSSIFVTASTPSSGTGGGSGGGGVHVCFSPNTRVKTGRGDIAIIDVTRDETPTARGTWGLVEGVTHLNYEGPMLDMGDGELVTPGHLFLKDGVWMKACEAHPEYPVVHYKGTIHNLQIRANDDGKAADTEHSYTLANGNVVHNIQTN